MGAAPPHHAASPCVLTGGHLPVRHPPEEAAKVSAGPFIRQATSSSFTVHNWKERHSDPSGRLAAPSIDMTLVMCVFLLFEPLHGVNM